MIRILPRQSRPVGMRCLPLLLLLFVSNLQQSSAAHRISNDCIEVPFVNCLSTDAEWCQCPLTGKYRILTGLKRVVSCQSAQCASGDCDDYGCVEDIVAGECCVMDSAATWSNPIESGWDIVSLGSSDCQTGYFLQGLYHGFGNTLSSLTQSQCLRPSNLLSASATTYLSQSTVSATNWSMPTASSPWLRCPPGAFLTGMKALEVTGLNQFTHDIGDIASIQCAVPNVFECPELPSSVRGVVTVYGDNCIHQLCRAQQTCQSGFQAATLSLTCLASGWDQPSLQCVDVSECARACGVGETPETHQCHDCAPTDMGGLCTELEGSFACSCVPGFSGNGTSCENNMECERPCVPGEDPLRDTCHPCSDGATCQEGSTPADPYACLCLTGYSGAGCLDDNECLDAADNNCHADATCTNTPGGYACTCNSGFQGDGVTCADVNECLRLCQGLETPVADGCHTCEQPWVCDNAAGDFSCSCPAGYHVVGGNCVDVPECQQECGGGVTDKCYSCANGGDCYERVGTYACGFAVSAATLDGSPLNGAVLPPTTARVEFTLMPGDAEFTLAPAFTFFGSQEYPFDFECVSTARNGNDIACDILGDAAVGGGLSLSIPFCLGTDCSYVYYHDADVFSSGGCGFVLGSLRNADSDPASSFPHQLPTSAEFGQDIFFDVTPDLSGFSPDVAVRLDLSSAFGRWPCAIYTITSAGGGEATINCRVPQDIVGPSFNFILTVGRGTGKIVAESTDQLVVSAHPSILSLSGCAGTDASGLGTTLCSTYGGELLTLLVTINASETLTAPVLVFVAGRNCPVQSTTIVGGGTSTITCGLPAGVGLFRSVLVSHTIARVFSALQSLVSYAPPSIGSISAASCTSTTNLRLTDCSSGSTQVQLTINGNNFGAAGAVVILAGGLSIPAVHVAGAQTFAEHKELLVTLPAAATLGSLDTDFSIVVVQQNGPSSSEVGYVSFRPCPAGTRELGNGTCVACGMGKFSGQRGQRECTPCAIGQFQQDQGRTECVSCSPGTYQPAQGQAGCLSCPVGWYSDVVAAGTCSQCPAGFVAPTNKSTTCTPCPQGQFQPLPGKRTCTACSEGKYNAANAQVSCTDCPAGKFTLTNASKACRACEKGAFKPDAGSGICQPCSAGRVAAELSSITCLPCLPGTWSGSKATFCTACATGRYQPNQAEAGCLPCGPGTFAPRTGAAECDQCRPGSVNNATQATGCTPCLVGEFSDEPGARVCKRCAKGRFSSTPRSASCTECIRGAFNDQEGQADCTLCPAGKEGLAIDNERTCVDCTPGKSQSGEGQTSCFDCIPGRFGTNFSARDCLDCPAGQYQSTSGALSCRPCQPGTESFKGSRECTVCGAGRFAPSTGTEVCSPCSQGSIPDESFTSCLCQIGFVLATDKLVTEANGSLVQPCERCPEGSECSDPGVTLGQMAAKSGWWRSRNTSRTFFRCPRPANCVGGVGSPCELYRTGPLCGICIENYRSASRNAACTACPATQGEAWGVAVGVVVLVLFVLGMMYFVVLRVSDAQEKGMKLLAEIKDKQQLEQLALALYGVEGDTIMEMEEEEAGEDDYDDEELSASEIAVKKRQKRGTQMSLTVGAGDTFKTGTTTKRSEQSILDHKGPVSLRVAMKPRTLASRRAPNFMYKTKILVGFFQVATIIGFQGEITWPTYFSAYIVWFKIFNFDFIPWQTLGCAAQITYFGKALIVAVLPFVVVLFLVGLFYVPMLVRDKQDMQDQLLYEQKRASSTRQFVKLFLFTVFLLYPFVSRMILSVYDCVLVEGVSYLLADMNLLCGTPTWNTYAGLLAFAVLLYPIGIPAVYSVLLYKNRAVLREPDTILQLGFLYEAYDFSASYWELLDMLHKLLLTSVVAFAPSFMEMQFNMFCLGVYLVLLLVENPYIRKGDDRLHLFAQIELFLLAQGGLVLQVVPITTKLEDIFISILLIALTTGFLCMFLVIAGRNVYKLYKLRRRHKESRQRKGHGRTKAVEADASGSLKAMDDEQLHGY